MTGDRVQLTSPGERRTLFVATAALHIAALVLLLLIRPVLPALADQPVLRVFDVAVPPTPAPAPPPPKPPTTAASGDGGAQRNAAAARTTATTLAPPEPIDTTVTIDAPAIAIPDLPDLGALSVGTPAIGDSSGRGTGEGDGVGSGSGPGAGAARASLLRAADWIRKPTPQEFRNVWPTRALISGMSGQAVLLCQVDDKGRARDCKVLRETPIGQGFGRAAVRLSPVFRVRPVTREGQAVDLPVVIPIYFDRR